MDTAPAELHRSRMHVRDFEFELPPEAIATRPAEPRDAARLLVHTLGGAAVGAAADEIRHRRIMDLPTELQAGDLLVVNDTRVLPARVHARRASGGRVELLFLEARPSAAEPRAWRALVKPARKLAPGERLAVEVPEERAVESAPQVVVRALEREGDGAVWSVALEAEGRDVPVMALLAEVGAVPLPPYITRAVEAADSERYQTLFARVPGAVAAPTAGLHFTSRVVEALERRGIERTTVTLHVGAGTFLPVTAERVEDHVMHDERYVLSAAACDAVARTKARGGRVIAVGTTSVRVLESCARADGSLVPGEGRTRLFLVPGAEFRVVDGLLTNFHLPGSTLLMLVAAFAGRERVLALYHEALAEGYRFYSYGDAMLLLR
jgi:S-adenosylmethionine:tRNA ribosyltransferase-isomerase